MGSISFLEKKLNQNPKKLLKLFFLVMCACASQAVPAHSFNSPEEFFAQDYAFFNKHFYKIDPFYYESKLENPLNLSPDFMLACLTHLYEKRADIICDSVRCNSINSDSMNKNKPIDALIAACWSIAGLQAKFLALKKSIQEYGFNFKQIHIFVGDAQHKALCKQLLAYLFSEKDQLPAINFIITNRQSELYISGLKLLKLSDQLAPSYIVVDSSHYFSDKFITESRNLFSGIAICLGSNVFPIKDPLLEARLHGYDKIYPDHNNLICAWFHSVMNMHVRLLHYNLTYKENVQLTEYYVAKRIRQKDAHHDLEKSYYFSKLGKLHLQKSSIAAEQATSFLELLRALGSLIYAKELYAPNNKYHLDQQITILKENVLLEFSKNGLSLLCDQRDLTVVYQKELESLHKSVTEKLQPLLNTGSSNNRMSNNLNNSASNQALGDIYHEISIARESLLKQIITDSLEVVGTPPCQFALIAYGSIARAEATPYSDIEFGIIVEKNNPEIQDYFEKLAAVIIYKLIDLGKTPVSHLNITSLTQQSPFIDFVIPAGFSPDTFNAKLPLVEHGGKAYFGTVAEIIDKQKQATKYAIEHKKEYHFITEKLLYGDENLFAQYTAEKHKNLIAFQAEAKKALDPLNPLLSKVNRENNGQVDIKKTFYRPFTCILESLDAFFGFNASSSHERIELLYIHGHITEQERQELQKFWHDILLFRLKMHMQNKQRYGNYSNSDQPCIDKLLDLKKKADTIFKAIFSTQL